MRIERAQRKDVKIKLAITGPSGAGKTMSSILLAHGLCPEGKILVIDSENKSSNLYADHPLTKNKHFDVLSIDAPYTIQKYIQALEMGVNEKYDVIILDSISHAWAGEGGLLDKKSAIDSRGGNSYTNWATVTKEQEMFKSKLLHASAHVIATMRSKQDYVMEANEKGKSAPKKVGLAPIQRDGMEYEFTTVFDVGMDHQFTVSKDRTGLFDGRIERITENTGKEIRCWLDGASKEEPKVIHEQKAVAPIPGVPQVADEVVVKHCESLLNAFSANDKNGGLQSYQQIKAELRQAVWAKMPNEFKTWFRQAMEA